MKKLIYLIVVFKLVYNYLKFIVEMAEVEERIARIKNHKGVKGLLIVDENGKFLRSTMSSSGNDTAPK